MPTFPKYSEFRSEICDLLKKSGIGTSTCITPKSFNIMSSSVMVPNAEGIF